MRAITPSPPNPLSHAAGEGEKKASVTLLAPPLPQRRERGLGGEGSGLTTGKAAFIEQAKSDGRLFIEQPYELYSEENHRAWRLLYQRMEESWERFANPHF